MGWGGERLGSGIPPFFKNDDWACAAFLLFHFGCLAVPGFGTDSFLARPRRMAFLVGFVVKGMVMVTYCGSVLQHVRDLPGFATLMSLDRHKWPRYLLCYGWLLGLSGTSDSDPWLFLLLVI